jgi:hypothetical protein
MALEMLNSFVVVMQIAKLCPITEEFKGDLCLGVIKFVSLDCQLDYFRQESVY